MKFLKKQLQPLDGSSFRTVSNQVRNHVWDNVVIPPQYAREFIARIRSSVQGSVASALNIHWFMIDGLFVRSKVVHTISPPTPDSLQILDGFTKGVELAMPTFRFIRRTNRTNRTI